MNIIGPDHFTAPAQKPSLKNIANFLEAVGNLLVKMNYRDVDTALIGRFVKVEFIHEGPRLMQEEEAMIIAELIPIGWKKVNIHALTGHPERVLYKVVFWFND